MNRKVSVLLGLLYSGTLFCQVVVQDDFAGHGAGLHPSWGGDVESFTILKQPWLPDAVVATDTFFLASLPGTGKAVLLTESTVTDDWAFSLASSAFSPSALNSFGVVLMCDRRISGSIDDQEWNGYFLRIGDSGDDKIALYKHAGFSHTLMGYYQTPSFSEKALANGIHIRISRKNDGAFYLSYCTGFGQPGTYIEAGSCTDNSFHTSTCFGIFQLFGNPGASRRVFLDNVFLENHETAYSWTGAVDGNFQNPQNWSPARPVSSSASDRLLFGVGETVQITNVPSQTLGCLVIDEQAYVCLVADGVRAQLTFARQGGGHGVQIGAGGELRLLARHSNDGYVLSLAAGTSARISGRLLFGLPDDESAGSHRLLAADSAAIRFERGSALVAAKLNGNAFGAEGTPGVAVFEDGSSYVCYDGGNPFGFAQPASKVNFSDSSFYYHRAATVPSLAGRRYGHFVFDKDLSMQVQFGSNTAAPCVMQDLIIEKGMLNIHLAANRQKLDFSIQGHVRMNHPLSGFSLTPANQDAHSVLAFNGQQSQTISGPGQFNIGCHATLSVSNPGVVLLEKALTVEGNISFSNHGKIRLGEHNISVQGKILGAGEHQFFITSAGPASDGGFLQTHVGMNDTVRIFPIGASQSSYTPCTISNNTGTAADFQVRVFDQIYAHGTYGDLLGHDNAVHKTWELRPVTGHPQVDVMLQWNAADEGFSFDRSRALLSKNKAVAENDDWGVLRTSTNGALGAGPYYLSATSLSDFSTFAVGDDGAPLPIELLAFTAVVQQGWVLVQWVTASEWNSERFVVERSAGRMGFEEISQVAGAGNTNALTEYSITDRHPVAGMNYYRLYQQDMNGAMMYYDPVAVMVDADQRLWWTQTGSGEAITLHLADATVPIREVRLFDQAGRQLRVEIRCRENQITFEQMPPPGCYFIVLETADGRSYSEKLFW